jgi:hypothetical protein
MSLQGRRVWLGEEDVSPIAAPIDAIDVRSGAADVMPAPPNGTEAQRQAVRAEKARLRRWYLTWQTWTMGYISNGQVMPPLVPRSVGAKVGKALLEWADAFYEQQLHWPNGLQVRAECSRLLDLRAAGRRLPRTPAPIDPSAPGEAAATAFSEAHNLPAHRPDRPSNTREAWRIRSKRAYDKRKAAKLAAKTKE